ncbi:MAG: hemolysin XhlA family protein [Crocosphaera sp.]|nr:hemolysin XhlA family protein [Crocosphaera sp.]
MNEPSSVTYTTADILKRIDNKLDKLEDKIDKQSEKIGTIEVKLAEIKAEVKNLNQDVKELKGSTKAQIWTLIGILVTAVSGFLVAVARFVFYPMA